MLFVGTSIIHPSTEGVFLLCNILDLLIYRLYYKKITNSLGMDIENQKTFEQVWRYCESFLILQLPPTRG